MSHPQLVYFADPMCSWCWGFSPVIAAIEARFGEALPVRVVLGGLRPGTVRAMSDRDRAEIRDHWRHVRDASGQPFDFAFFDRPHFVYDTEPASRAVTVMRRRGPGAGLTALKRIQSAFYAENRDVTDIDTLVALAAEIGFEAEAFRADLEGEAAIEETRGDFSIAQNAGVRGFPTLIAGTGEAGRWMLVTHGYQPATAVVPALERWLATIRPDEGTPTEGA